MNLPAESSGHAMDPFKTVGVRHKDSAAKQALMFAVNPLLSVCLMAELSRHAVSSTTVNVIWSLPSSPFACDLCVRCLQQLQYSNHPRRNAGLKSTDNQCVCRTCCSTTLCARSMDRATQASMVPLLSRPSMRPLWALWHQLPASTWNIHPSPM